MKRKFGDTDIILSDLVITPKKRRPHALTKPPAKRPCVRPRHLHERKWGRVMKNLLFVTRFIRFAHTENALRKVCMSTIRRFAPKYIDLKREYRQLSTSHSSLEMANVRLRAQLAAYAIDDQPIQVSQWVGVRS